MITALLIVNGLLIGLVLAGVAVWAVRKLAPARHKARRRIGSL